MVITLLRHGMTADNERAAYIGWSNPALSKTGRIEVEEIKEKLTTDIQHVFSSDLKRCLETAEILYPNHQLKEMQGLREINFGDWEGKTYEQLKHLASYRFWLDQMYEGGPDGGETFATFTSRVQQAFEEIKKQMLAASLHNVAIVAHGGVLRYLLSVLVDSDKAYFDWKVPYGSGYKLCWKKEAFRRGELCTWLQEVPLTERQHG